jgi:hypothetical protein
MLGGDPEAAYLVVLCGGFYALGLTVHADRAPREGAGAAGDRPAAWRLMIGLPPAILVWAGVTTAAAGLIKADRTRTLFGADLRGRRGTR